MKRHTDIRDVELPMRSGDRPRTTAHAPHSQIDQLPDEDERLRLSEILIRTVSTLPYVSTGGSLRAPPGTVGLYLDRAHARKDSRRFLLGREFAHVHVKDDASLHAILPEPERSNAIEHGWAEPHPLAGRPTVSPDTVMIYSPRDEQEVDVVARLVRCSLRNALR